MVYRVEKVRGVDICGRLRGRREPCRLEQSTVSRFLYLLTLLAGRLLITRCGFGKSCLYRGLRSGVACALE
jgi:hypothetical protein